MNLPAQILSNGEYVFNNIENQVFQNIDARKVIIKNSIIRDCSFLNVDMGYCDLLSSKIYNVSFEKVSFKCADIYSLWFSECEFQDVDFSGAGIEDITFNNCCFKNCIFEDVGLKKCVFSNSDFYQIRPVSSGFILNQYNNCFFKDCQFMGSFQYQIFDECKFDNVKFEYFLLKNNFGIGTVQGIQYIKNSQQIANTTQLYELLKEECFIHKLFLNAAIVSFNFESPINPLLIIKSIDGIKKMLSKDILIRNDELIFVKQLYHYLYEKKMIPPIVLYQLLTSIRNIKLELGSNVALIKCQEALSMIYNDLSLKFYGFCDELQEIILKLPDYELPMKLYVDYNYEPNMSLSDVLNQCLPNTFIRIKSEYGSFHEIIEMMPSGLEVLNIFLQILGISIPIIYAETKEKKKQANQKQDNKNTEIDKSINFNIISQNNSKKSMRVIEQTCKIITSSGILNENLQGYNNNNIKKIKIQYNINIQV